MLINGLCCDFFFLRKKWSKLGCVLYTGAHAMHKKLCFSQRLCLTICPHKRFKSETVIYYGDFKITEVLLLLVYEKNLWEISLTTMLTIKILFTINWLFGYCMGNFCRYDWIMARKHRIKVLQTDLI